MEKILSLFAERKQKATFYVLGWIAEKYPEIVKNIDLYGHEIGSHSHMHRLVYEQSRKEFRRDLETSICRLEDILGKKVRYYRAPGFSITPETPWAFETLLDLGIEIDGSLFVSERSHGGYGTFPIFSPCFIETHGMRLKEFPVVPYKCCGMRIVFSGGGYFRLLPYGIIRFFTKQSPYIMTYFHCRDFDKEQPRIAELPLKRQFKAYVGIKNSMKKLICFLDDFSFTDLASADAAFDWKNAPVVTIS
jgi:polysaccharide deacetylase family protein (PEP-CTERM system associated)